MPVSAVTIGICERPPRERESHQVTFGKFRRKLSQSFHLDRRATLAVILLAGLTLAVFVPVAKFQFINVDDDAYVMGNSHVPQGLTWRGAAWAMTAFEAGNWHPVTWLSHMLDVSLFGMNPAGHHATSLLIHTLNVVLLFWWLRTMTGALGKSAAVAALFAIHPLALESVAWVAERKNVLSTFFLLLTLLTYVAYVRKPGLARYLMVALCLTLGLMSKPMLVTAPFLLLLLDYWPLGRLRKSRTDLPEGETPQQDDDDEISLQIFLRRSVEKLPLLLLAAISSILTMKAQALDHEIKSVSLSSRIANALISYGTYLWQMVWPSKLAIFYPYRDRSLFSLPAIAALALICGVTALALWQAKKRPYLAFGWFWYLGTLIPVVGLVHVGDLAHADRYTYVPLIGIFIAIVWSVDEIGERVPRLRHGIMAAAAASVIALAITTTRDISYWHDGISVSEHALSVTGSNTLMERALGEAFYAQGHLDEALEHLTRSIAIEPTDTALFEVGTIKLQQQQPQQAVFCYRKALAYPGDPHTLAQIHNNLAVLEMQQNLFADAEKDFRQSIALAPDSARHRVAYGWLLVKLGRYDEAVSEYQQAIAISPDALAYFSMGSALEQQRRIPEAVAAYRKTLALAPDFQNAKLRLDALAGAR